MDVRHNLGGESGGMELGVRYWRVLAEAPRNVLGMKRWKRTCVG